jgi:hypothetical protein
MKYFHTTVVFASGLSAHTTNFKAKSEKDAIVKIATSAFYENDTIVSIVVIENQKMSY